MIKLIIYLTRNNRNATVEVEKEIPDKNMPILIKIIDKAKTGSTNLTPLANFLKSKDISALQKLEWKISDVDFIIDENDLLQYYEKQGIEGGCPHHARDTIWPHISYHMIGRINYKLMEKGKIVPAPFFKSGGYITPNLKNKHNDIIGERRRNRSIDLPESKKKKEKKQSIKVVELTKKEMSECRKSIIEKSTLSNITKAGFKQEFIDSLNEKEQSYLIKISNLQTKLMINEISKKNQ